MICKSATCVRADYPGPLLQLPFLPLESDNFYPFPVYSRGYDFNTKPLDTPIHVVVNFASLHYIWVAVIMIFNEGVDHHAKQIN